MIERTMINGRPCTVAYIRNDFTPADKDTFDLVKVLFDDGEVVFLANPDAVQEKRSEKRYSPDQPRDPDGKFGEGEGTEKTGVAAAIADLNAKFPVNPENDKERLLLVNGSRVGSFEVTERAGRLRIKSIEADTPGQGVGTTILHRITNAADRHGVTLELTASSKGSQHLSTDQLKEWYGKHGFVQEPGTDEAYGYMIREPR